MAGEIKGRHLRTLWNRFRAAVKKLAPRSHAGPADQQQDTHEKTLNDQYHAEPRPILDLHEAVLPYQYAPLNEKAQEIRLLTILPGNFSSDMRVCLHITPFAKETELKFEALSYCWGSPAGPIGIFVGESGNRTIKVTQNIVNALPYLRYPGQSRKMWIDAICVNQQDLEEKSRQIKRMANIYSVASRVIV